jgi:hypothetical protein
MRKKHKKVLICVGVVVVVLGTIYAIALIKAQARLRRAYAALEADGRPMLAAELIPPPIPDAKNAAPLFMAAARPLKAQASGIRDLLDRLQTLSRRSIDGDMDQEDLDEFKGYLAQDMVKASLKLFEQGLQRPKCRFNRDYDQGLLVDLHEAREMRSLLHIRRAKNRLEAENGEPDGSWDRVFLQFRLADVLRSDPVFWSQITRYSMARTGCSFIQGLCSTDPPDAQAYQRLQQILMGLDDDAPLLRALDGERLLKGEWLFNLPMDKLYEALQRDKLFGGGPSVFSRILFSYVKFKPRLVADHAAYLEAMHMGTQILRAPYDPNADQGYRDLAGKSLLTSQMRPMAGYGKRWHCGIAAHARITRAGLAVLQHRQTHGVYPASLDILGLKGLTDPFSQKPLIYLVQGENFSIYSVGENRQDNQGKPRQRKHKEYDDIAWHFPPLSMRESVDNENEVARDL